MNARRVAMIDAIAHASASIAATAHDQNSVWL
jgi:hypothetical protein